jgi:acetyl esterase/lipase
MRADWIIPKQAAPNKAILFAHGGGYVSGSCSDHQTHVAKFAEATGLRALLYEYRLAPEHPYPAALEDSVTAYQWLLDQGFTSRNIAFIGDSAGGGLCLTLLLALKERGITLPAAAVAVSPWTDLSCSGQAYFENAARCLSPQGCWQAFAAHYTAGHDPRDPMVSPLFGDLEGLPPLFITAGDQEILLDDASGFASKAREAGVAVTLKIGQGLFHCYPVCGNLFPEAAEAMREIADFVKAHVAR